MATMKDEAASKMEQEVERHVLSLTVNLSDGSRGHVFTRNPHRNEAKMLTYNCHLCSVPNLSGERCLYTHINGRKHQSKLITEVYDAELFRTPMSRGNKIVMKIAPGEPVPPGFENEVKPVAELQAAIDKCKDMSLIGLEYLLELLRGDGKEPSYLCVICEKRGDPRTIIDHITSYKHRLKYLEKHFPTATREVTLIRNNGNARDILPGVIQSICEAIEDTYGRLSPNVYDEEKYNKNRMVCLQEVISDKHFDEKMGSTFLHLIDRHSISKQVEEVAQQKIKKIPPSNERQIRDRSKSLDSLSSISDSSFGRKSPGRNQSRQAAKPIDDDDDVIFVDSSARPRSQTRQSGTSSQKISKETGPDRFKLEKYRHLRDPAVKKLEDELKEHEKNPEKHPLYPDEWKKFWNRRYKELQAEKKDPMKHDFKPEWIIFWTHRMKELHDEAVVKKEKEIRKKLNLSEDGKEAAPSDKKEKYAIKVNVKTDRRTVTASTSSIKRSSPSKEIRPSSSTSSARRERTKSRSRERDRYRDRLREKSLEISRERQRRDRSRSRERKRTRSPEKERNRERIRGSRERERSRERIPPQRISHSSISEEENEHFAPKRVRREGYDDYYDNLWHAPPPSHYYSGQPYHPPHPYYARELSYHRPPPEAYIEQYEEDNSNEPLTVVSVLRLLTAVEELLGPSLGPKVIDLLAKALALEKVKANSADDLLLNEDNCVLFETIKEKLKGQLIAEVIEKHQIKAVKKAIKNIAGVVHMVSEREKNISPEEKQHQQQLQKLQQLPSQSVSKPTIESSNPADIDKAEIAKKLAAALVAQGKTDITPDQLESLIQVYTEMERKKREAAAASALILPSTSEQKPSTSTNNDNLTANSKSIENNNDSNDRKTHDEEFDLPQDASNALESLTDSDLQTLLQNFKDLSTEEQHHLIAYLKKLESVDPKRVEKLRKSVNIDQVLGPTKQNERNSSLDTKRNVQSGSKQLHSKKNRFGDMFYDDENDKVYEKVNNKNDEDIPTTIIDSDDDDDDDNYSYDDVFKAASKNVKENETKQQVNVSKEGNINGKSVNDANFFDIGNNTNDSNHSSRSNNSSSNPQNFNKTLADTQSIVANLMGSLQKNVQRQRSNQNDSAPNSSVGQNATSSGGIKSNMPFYQQQQILSENSAPQTTFNPNQINSGDNYANAAQFLQNLMPTINHGIGMSQMPTFSGQQMNQSNPINFPYQQMSQQQQQPPPPQLPQPNMYGQFQHQYPFNANNNPNNSNQFDRRYF